MWFLRKLIRSIMSEEQAKLTYGLGRDAAIIARDEIGAGEVGSNNGGPHVRRYRGDTVKGAWCAAFVGWCFQRAAERKGLRLPFKWSNGAKRIYKNIGKAGKFIDKPQVGAVACWDRGRRGSWQGHVGIVTSLARDEAGDDPNVFYTVEGNKGRFPSLVAEFKHVLDEGRLIGFATLDV